MEDIQDSLSSLLSAQNTRSTKVVIWRHLRRDRERTCGGKGGEEKEEKKEEEDEKEESESEGKGVGGGEGGGGGRREVEEGMEEGRGMTLKRNECNCIHKPGSQYNAGTIASCRVNVYHVRIQMTSCYTLPT